MTGGFFNYQPETAREDSRPTIQQPIAFSSKDNGADASDNLSPTLRASGHDESHANAGAPPAIAFPARMSATQCAKSEDVSCVIGAANPTGVMQPAIAIQEIGKRQSGTPENGVGYSKPGDPMFTLQSGAQHGVATSMAVRRLTPRECERLQGFPDCFTMVEFNGKPACDGPRYKAIGNSMAVPNIEWIGRRMDLVDELVPWVVKQERAEVAENR